MNPHNTTESTTLTLQPPVAQPPRSSFSCDRHPQERFSGFCPSCLCERLAGLDKSQSCQSQSSSLPRKSAAAGTMSSTAAAALKAIFRSGTGPSSMSNNISSSSAAVDKDKDKDNSSSSRSSNRNSASSKPSSSFLAELRRTKSFSASKGEGLTGVFEPQRKSCDVRVRNNNTLFTLFNQYDARKSTSKKEGVVGDAAADDLDIDSEVEKNTRRIPCASASASAMVGARVLETEDNGGIEEEDYYEEKIEEEQEEDDVDEIRVVEEHPPNAMMGVEEDRGSQVKEFVDFQEEEEERPMKDHIDLESQMKKPPLGLGGAGRRSFWSAASVFSKKLQKWGRKQKLKKWGPSDGSASATLPVDKRLRCRTHCETQSEVADYGFGRRSCDTDPRFSLDAARISFDDPRYSLDEPPRVSWDGYLMGRSLPPRLPPMVSVVEDDAPPPPPPPPPPPVLSGSDNQIPVAEVELPPPLLSRPSVAPASTLAANCNNHHVEHAYDHSNTTTNNNSNIANETTPGGSAQTREYYSDSCSRRRKSLDRSSSIKKKTAAAEVAEMDDPKVDCFHGPKASGDGGDLLMDSNSLKDKDDCSETFQLGSTFKDHASVLGNNGDHKAALKKSRRWKVWNILGLIYNRRHGASRYEEEEEEDDDRFGRLTGVDRSFSSSWQEFRREGNVDSGFHSRRVLRSNSSVSSRNLSNFGGPGFGGSGSVRRNSSGIEANGYGSSKNNRLDNGQSKFYLTPLRGSWRSTSANNRFNSSHSIARSVMRLY